MITPSPDEVALLPLWLWPWVPVVLGLIPCQLSTPNIGMNTQYNENIFILFRIRPVVEPMKPMAQVRVRVKAGFHSLGGLILRSAFPYVVLI